ncbi:hypothetical protein OEZ86_010770 [Tetradesmus obliquus]|nr:hypothetical protein OEZ86_010770 [Tetradesmus obliquus]
MGRWRLYAVCLALLVAAWAPTCYSKRHLRLDSPLAAFTSKTAYGCPKHKVFNDPWVADNVAFTYAVVIKDGLGGQVTRMMGVYALAEAMGVRYVHSPLSCIGHIGGQPHWRNQSCDGIDPADAAKMQRLSSFLSLANTTAADTSSWAQELFTKGSWLMLANVTETALRLQRPTVVRIEWVHNFLSDCPDLFFHVPAWRPSNPQPQPVDWQGSWLLDGSGSKRIVVHMRRGDVTSLTTKRALPTSFYLNVVKQVIQVCDFLGLDYTVEWFTEAGSTAADHEDLLRVRREIPNLTVLLNSDILWNWHQMASADVFVMSKSAYSMVPAVVNPNALIIRAPPATICKVSCQPSSWLLTEDFEGNLSQEALYYVRRRLSGGAAAAAQEQAATHTVLQQ